MNTNKKKQEKLRNPNKIISIFTMTSNTAPIKYAQRKDSLYLTIALAGPFKNKINHFPLKTPCHFLK